MRHYLLEYDLIDDRDALIEAHRDAHRCLARTTAETGLLRLAGGVGDPIDSAALLFRATDRRAVEDFACADPYVIHGVVRGWKVRELTMAVGADLPMPVSR